ncbi:hypothetical protein RF11_04731 [Thelohanellus kitauei]|uniref:Uncharacterized protein n=1 Tax=Thelohanellus kitauei TaxID=669202 RepID=A0A0C2MQ48_THEKT|nr:hypothetical protein RF11_04731 [Thelohanellus kitauei]
MESEKMILSGEKLSKLTPTTFNDTTSIEETNDIIVPQNSMVENGILEFGKGSIPKAYDPMATMSDDKSINELYPISNEAIHHGGVNAKLFKAFLQNLHTIIEF